MPATKRERLSFDDTQILRLESAAIKGHTGKILVLAPDSGGRPLDPGALRARVAERISALPRLRQRIEESRLPFGRPAWMDAPEVDLDWHVAEPSHSDALSDEEFRRTVGEVLAQRLDHTRPLWRFDLIPLSGDRMGIVGRIHHAMADGMSAIHLAAGLFWDADAPAPREKPRSREKLDSPAAHDAKPHQPPAPAAGETRILLQLPAALWRELRPGEDSALDEHIGPHREVAWTTFPLDRLKRIEHGAGEGVTVNDVVLAIVAGGSAPGSRAGTGDPTTCACSAPSRFTPARRTRAGSATATPS